MAGSKLLKLAPPALGTTRVMALPRYLLYDQGEAWGDFEDASDWTCDQGSIATNTTEGEYRAGASSITLTSGVGSNGRMIRDYTIRYFDAAKPRCKLMVYMYAADIDNIDRILVLIGKSNYSEYLERAFEYTNYKFRVGWNTLEVHTNQWGSTQDARTGYQRVRVTLVPKAGVQAHISVDSLVVDVVGVPAVMFTFDDGFANVYTEGFSYMTPRKARGTWFINTALPDTGSYVTSAQLQAVYAAGWAVANHSCNATDFTTLSEAEIETNLGTAHDWLGTASMPRSAHHVAYPSCGVNETVVTAMGDAGMLTGRSCKTYGVGPTLDANFDQVLSYPISIYVDSTTTLAAMQTVADNCKTYKQLGVYVFHEIRTGSGNIITPANFRALVDYIVGRDIPFVTIDDIYSSLSGAIQVTRKA